jgi:predicted O-methyltransferase YrrM
MQHDHPRFSDTLIALESEFGYRDVSISREKGEFLWNLIREHHFSKTIEIGCAYGISSLYICDALSQSRNVSHTAIDPDQTRQWHNIGIRNIQARGFHFFSLIEGSSELILPKLLERKEIFDFAFIDGWHTFDHALLDFFYLNKLVRVGGMIVFDDADWSSISKVIKYLSTYPAYEVVLPPIDIHVPPLTFRQQLLRLLYYGTKLIPQNVRTEIFSERLVMGQIRTTPCPTIVGLMKVAEDNRSFFWYENFCFISYISWLCCAEI